MADMPIQNSQPEEVQPLLFDTKQVAKLLSISPSGVRKLQRSGRMPPIVRVGRCVRWNREELHEWVKAGCPSHDKWLTMKGIPRRKW